MYNIISSSYLTLNVNVISLVMNAVIDYINDMLTC